MKAIRNTVFCELPVIEQIITDYWNTRLDLEASQDELTAYQHWYLLLSKYSDLIVDKSEIDFIELSKSNPIYMKLLKHIIVR